MIVKMQLSMVELIENKRNVSIRSSHGDDISQKRLLLMTPASFKRKVHDCKILSDSTVNIIVHSADKEFPQINFISPKLK